MWVYLLNVLLIIIYGIMIKDRKKIVIVASLQLFLLLALRESEMGVDYISYFNGYNYIKNLSLNNLIENFHFFDVFYLNGMFAFESGYVLLCWILSHLGFSYHFLLIVLSAINIYAFGLFIYKYSKIPWLSFVILCTFGIYSYFFGILRQSLALSLIILSIIKMDENKKITSIIFFVLAFLSHRTSIIMLPFLFIVHKNGITKKNYLIALGCSIPYLLLSSRVYALSASVLSFFNKGSYISHSMQINNMIILLYIISVLVLIFAKFKDEKDNNMFNLTLIIFICSIFFEILGLYNDAFGRSMQIFNSFLVLLIPYVINHFQKQREIVFIKIFIVLLLCSFMYYTLPSSRIIPYKIETENFIFDK